MSDQIIPKGLVLIFLLWLGGGSVATVWKETRWSSRVKAIVSAGWVALSLAFIYAVVIRVHWYPATDDTGTP